MLLNAGTALLSSKVLLVPYEPHHVSTYHGWMADDEIREATASERLSLEEEYRMQLKWRNDADKLTFIICLPPAVGRDGKRCDSPIVAKWGDSPENMVGDINLFIFEDPHADEPKEGGGYVPDRGQIGKRKLVGEVELMIARREYQGKGIGRASLLLFLWYIIVCRAEIIGAQYKEEDAVLSYLRAKISKDNKRSIKLFESLLFKKTSDTPNYFGEYELVLKDLDIVRIIGAMRTHGVDGWKSVEYSYGEGQKQ